MNPIEERKAYLKKRNEIAKELLLNNISDIDLSSYILPDIGSKFDNISSSIISSLGSTSREGKAKGIYAKIAEWILKLKTLLDD